MSAMLAKIPGDKATAAVEALPQGRKRVVIIGAGFAGIAAGRALRHADASMSYLGIAISLWPTIVPHHLHWSRPRPRKARRPFS